MNGDILLRIHYVHGTGTQYPDPLVMHGILSTQETEESQQTTSTHSSVNRIRAGK